MPCIEYGACPAATFLLFTFYFLLFTTPAFSQENPCLICHGQFKKPAKAVHAALGMGCETCHQAVEGLKHPQQKGSMKLMQDIPGLCYGCHEEGKFKAKATHSPVAGGMCTSCHNPHQSEFSKILISEQPNLCYNCHNKFTKKVLHAALSMGCTGCHNPHSSKNAKLLLLDLPDLCYGCHERKVFEGKSVHSPIAAGLCPSCHNPHQSELSKLLVSSPPDLCYNCHDKGEFTKKNIHVAILGGCDTCHKVHSSANKILLLRPSINDLCRQCHLNVGNNPHALAGWGRRGHPLRGPKDLLREGKEFSCSSCHNPHSSDFMRLFRYKAESTFGICRHCHKM